jgi:ribosomal protein S18 acetylase RimI-like enzyme
MEYIMSIIREMTEKDKSDVLEMMKIFYASPAVITNGSDEIFRNDIENCINDNPYLEGFVVENSNGIQGYAMIAKSFSTEFGKPCIWIEDLYIKDSFRGVGLGKMLLEYITHKYTDCIFRLEAEEENERAVKLYKKCGFTVLPYLEMKK